MIKHFAIVMSVVAIPTLDFALHRKNGVLHLFRPHEQFPSAFRERVAGMLPVTKARTQSASNWAIRRATVEGVVRKARAALLRVPSRATARNI